MRYDNLLLMLILAGFLVGCGNYNPAGIPLGQLEQEQYESFTYSESYTPQGNANYKIGKGYQIEGTWYYPEIDYDYTEVGIASWYGPKFHNKKTANGEVFNQDALTAAHRTLPLPSIVIVHNLENGRSVKLRVNDRGPFARGRIIDVSKRAAEILGFSGQGTAPVRVTIVENESRRLAQSLGGKQEVLKNNSSVGNLQGQELIMPQQDSLQFYSLPKPPKEATVADTTQTKKPETKKPEINNNVKPLKIDFSKRIFIQVGAFVEAPNVDRALLAFSKFGYPVLRQEVGRDNLTRVLVGPLNTMDKDKIEELLTQAINIGYQKSYIYVSEK
ncbi:MAG: septal ring lytic transglycosylase RlpA family protein [Alphaproteobacteria bacterium]|nr:septal ring lytic transglycosylase RlpA family protein [Alphaproteobacteria bacterium]